MNTCASQPYDISDIKLGRRLSRMGYAVDPNSIDRVLNEYHRWQIKFNLLPLAEGRSLSQAREEVRRSLYQIRHALWAEVEIRDRVLSCVLVMETRSFDLKTLSGVLRQLRVPISKSSSTRIRNFHNYTVGWSSMFVGSCDSSSAPG